MAQPDFLARIRLVVAKIRRNGKPRAGIGVTLELTHPSTHTMKILRNLITAFVAVSVSAIATYAADPSGTWTWKRQFQDREITSTMKLELKEGELTGTVSGFRGGENAISNAKFENDEVSFDVVVEFNGNSRTQKYHGKLEGNTITGMIHMQGRDGQSRELDWNATRDS